jgi:LacI family transcriptional regulator
MLRKELHTQLRINPVELVKIIDQPWWETALFCMLKPLARKKSLIFETADAVRSALEQGVFTGRLPGERKLCEMLRVSRPTLRAALGKIATEGWVDVAQGRPRRVLRRVRSPIARARPKLVVLTPLHTEEMPGAFRVILEELRNRLLNAEMLLEVVVEPGAFSARPHRMLDALVQAHPESIWLLHLSAESTQRWFFERAVPCVLAGTPVDGVSLPGVDLDYRAACRHAASTFLNAGRRHLAMLIPEGGRGGEEESRAGFLEGVSGRGSTLVEPWVMRHDASVLGVCRALQRLLRQTPRIDGLLVGRAGNALTVLTHLLRTGIRVPGDIALISRDDDPFLAHTDPAVARYGSRPSQFAGALTRMVEKLVQGSASGGEVRLIVPDLIRAQTLK